MTQQRLALLPSLFRNPVPELGQRGGIRRSLQLRGHQPRVEDGYLLSESFQSCQQVGILRRVDDRPR